MSVVSVKEVKAQNIIGELLKRMDLHNKALQSLQADLMMIKTDENLGPNGTDKTSGNISYLPKTAKRAMYARLNWTNPTEEWMLVIGDAYKTYRPKINQGYEGKADKTTKSNKVGGALAFMSMSKEQLKANYEIIYIGQERANGVETWHLQLTPKTAQSYKLAELWVDSDGMPRIVKVTEKNNDTSTIVLANIKKNIPISPSVFKLDIPKNANMHNL